MQRQSIGHLVPVSSRRFFNFKTKQEPLEKQTDNTINLQTFKRLTKQLSSSTADSDDEHTQVFEEMKRNLEKEIIVTTKRSKWIFRPGSPW